MSGHERSPESGLRGDGKRIRPLLLGAALLAIGLGLVACGSDGSIAHPPGKNEVVLQVTTGGGFVPIEYNVTLVPEFSLYGDGRVTVPGPMMEIYPGPAMPNIQTAVIPEESIQAVLSAAREAGLFDPMFDYGLPTVADGPTTTIVINADGTKYGSEIYALTVEGAGGLTMEQQRARAAINDLVSKLIVLSTFVAGEILWERYDFSALAIYSQAVGPNPTDVQPNRLDWPLGDLGTLGEEVPPGGFRRVVISGQDLAALRTLLGQATEITLWKSGGAEYRLLFRPLLPDETA